MIWILPALATEPAVDPEGERIAEELLRYATDSRWTAVDDQYLRLITSHPTEVTGEIHRLGAQAARLDGNLLLSAQRLQRVPDSSPDHADVARDLDLLRSTTGLVMIALRDPRAFEPVQMPFSPELRKAVETASARLGEQRWFVGLLPTGGYRIDGTVLEVAPGFEWQVLSTR